MDSFRGIVVSLVQRWYLGTRPSLRGACIIHDHWRPVTDLVLCTSCESILLSSPSLDSNGQLFPHVGTLPYLVSVLRLPFSFCQRPTGYGLYRPNREQQQ